MQVLQYKSHFAGGRRSASWDLLAIWRRLHSTITSSLSDLSQYPCLRNSVYLNQASLGLISQPAVAAMHSFLETVARHGNLYMSDNDEINYGRALRRVAGRLFHKHPSRIAILASASELLGQFPMLFRLKPNAAILAVS